MFLPPHLLVKYHPQELGCAGGLDHFAVHGDLPFTMFPFPSHQVDQLYLFGGKAGVSTCDRKSYSVPNPTVGNRFGPISHPSAGWDGNGSGNCGNDTLIFTRLRSGKYSKQY